MVSLDSLFCPSSVAVIGASRESGKVGNTILNNIINSQFEGKIFPINPKSDIVHGLKCYSSILDVPQDVDLAVIVIPGKYVLPVLDECSKKNVKAAIIISAGFKEVGREGARLEMELVKKAKEYGIRVLGPNCLGMIDTSCPLDASFSPTFPGPGAISFISQSGALGTSVLDWAKFANIGISKFVSLGNKSDISENDCIKYMKDDDSCRVITAYIEGVKDGRDFIDICKEVSKHKPIIVVKAGNTSAGAKAVSSHTGTLAGSGAAYTASFKQSGIIRANTIKNLFDYANTFANQPLPNGKKVAIITNAGGPGIMATDACEERDIPLATLDKETIEKLKGFLPAAANFYNPVDVLGDAGPDRYQKTLEVVLDDKSVEAVIVILTPQAVTQPYKTAQAIVEELEDCKEKVPLITCFMGGSAVQKGIKYLRDNGIPNYDIPESAVGTLRVMFEYSEWKNKKTAAVKEFKADRQKVRDLFKQRIEEGRYDLGEMEARTVLEAYSIAIPKAELARDIDEAKKIAEKIGFPVVLKIVSPNILHKTDVGGIKVGINSQEELVEEFEQMLWNVKRYMPDANIKGILVQEMIQSKKETIIGINNDPQFGPMIMFGLGGIYVEVLKDVSFRIAPITNDDAVEMINEIKAVKLLRGARGETPSDIDSIVDVLVRISQLVMDFPEIIEMDINPLFVKKKGEGSIAGDVRIRIGEN
ncbi:MAG: acetate--CoA ligase alpha subunit [Actinomycetota bacterium]